MGGVDPFTWTSLRFWRRGNRERDLPAVIIGEYVMVMRLVSGTGVYVRVYVNTRPSCVVWWGICMYQVRIRQTKGSKLSHCIQTLPNNISPQTDNRASLPKAE